MTKRTLRNGSLCTGTYTQSKQKKLYPTADESQTSKIDVRINLNGNKSRPTNHKGGSCFFLHCYFVLVCHPERSVAETKDPLNCFK